MYMNVEKKTSKKNMHVPWGNNKYTQQQVNLQLSNWRYNRIIQKENDRHVKLKRNVNNYQNNASVITIKINK